MNKFLLILIIAACMMILPSCRKTDSEAAVSEDSDNIVGEDSDDSMAGFDESENDDVDKIVSALDGLKYYPEVLNRRPVAVSIDNHPGARQQAGLGQAEIVYEVEVEFPYTRYLCIFQANEPKSIGPVRSARPYIIYYALENDGIFVHVGGSPDAFSEISRLSVADVDGLYSSAMWRFNDTGKRAPHNVYTDLKSIREEASKYGYRSECKFDGYSFAAADRKLSDSYSGTQDAYEINIVYNKDNNTCYKYDEEDKLYLRFKDGEKHTDELAENQITAKNIVILNMTRQVLDNEGRIEISSVGKGEGYYISDGSAVAITWQKKSENSRTLLYAGDDILVMNPGNTWFQITSQTTEVEFNDAGGEH